MIAGKSWLRAEWIIPLVLTLVFGVLVKADYLRWDDRDHIFENRALIEGAYLYFWKTPYYDLYIPVIYNVWTALFQINSDPWVFHLFNVVLHILNTYLVYRWCRTWNGDEHTSALLAALTFGLHPQQVETIAWISAGRDQLAMAFCLIAVLVAERDRSWKKVTLMLPVFAAGLLCKPTMAPLAGGFVLMALILGQGSLWTRLREVWPYSTWIAAGLAASVLAAWVQREGAALRAPSLTLPQQLAVGLDSTGFYLQKFLAPVGLSAEYGRTPGVVLEKRLWIYTIGLLAAVSAGLWFARKHLHRRVWAALAMSFLFALPTLGFIPYQAQFNTSVADRYMYLPMVAWALGFAVALPGRRWLQGLVLAALLPWSALSFQRALVYMNDFSFYGDMWNKDPGNFNAAVGLSVSHIKMANYAEGERWVKLALQTKPMHVTAVTALGSAYFITGRPQLIVSELEPMVQRPDFLAYNKLETRPLAALYRLLGLANHQVVRWERAHWAYCKYFELDPTNMAVRAEFEKFRFEMAAIKGSAPNCP